MSGTCYFGGGVQVPVTAERIREVVVNEVGDEMIATLFDGVGVTKASDAGSAFERAAADYLGDSIDWDSRSIDGLRATNEAWGDTVGNMPIEYIPLRYLLSAMPSATVESIYRTSTAIESDWGAPVTPIPYDRWCGCGEWVNRPDPFSGLVGGLFGAARDEQGVVLAIASNGVTSIRALQLPTAPTFLMGAAIVLLAERYVAGANVPIDPNVPPDAARNYWQDLSGSPRLAVP